MKNSPVKLLSYYARQRLRATVLHERIFIAAMLNPSQVVLRKSLAGLVEF